MIAKIKSFLATEVKFYVAIFALLSVAGWSLNGYKGTHFNIGDLVLIFGTIVVNATGEKFIDSKYNSPLGMPPQKNQEVKK